MCDFFFFSFLLQFMGVFVDESESISYSVMSSSVQSLWTVVCQALLSMEFNKQDINPLQCGVDIFVYPEP